MDNMWSKTRYSYQTVGVDSDTDNYTQQIATYLEGRQKGLSQEQIANDIFKVSIGGPITLALGWWNNANQLQVDFPGHVGCTHSYPFVTGDTFRAFADVVFDNTEHYP